jgi:hypothetical protein
MPITPLQGIDPAELAGKRHTGQPDTPELGTLGMQQLFDALPDLLTEKLNALVTAQNANNSQILAKDNVALYTPTGDYHPATKKYVADSIAGSGNVTPEQVASWDAKADKAVPETAGNLASLDVSGNLQDSGKAPEEFALAADSMPKSGGSFTGAVIAGGAQAVGTAQVRNVLASTDDLTAGVSELATGTLYLVYE